MIYFYLLTFSSVDFVLLTAWSKFYSKKMDVNETQFIANQNTNLFRERDIMTQAEKLE